MYKVYYTKTAAKQISLLRSVHLDDKAKKLIEIIKNDPFQNPPPYEKLCGDLEGLYSRRLNIWHRLVYEVNEAENAIKIVGMWTHYEYK